MTHDQLANLMLVEFTLLPISRIEPWGEPGKRSLHWFGLTDGQYWLEVGDEKLFEYSKDAQSAGVGRYCEYPVVRLHQDLLEMLPHILEPVPDALVQYLPGETVMEWRAALDAWCDGNGDRLETNRFDQIIDAAVLWSGARRLDSGHLTPSANIIIWSDTDHIYVEWDNRDIFYNGKLAWSAVRGRYQIPRAAFIAEVRTFHQRLMGQMSDRVRQVQAGALAPDINIDIPGLVRDHERRSRELQDALGRPAQTDWSSVAAAIDEVLRV